MRGKTFSEEQIIGVLKEAEAGMVFADLLGTVQFGKQYGIANTKGQPSYEDVRLFIIIRAANGAGRCTISGGGRS